MSDFRKSNTEEGMLISPRLLDDIMRDLAYCKQQLQIAALSNGRWDPDTGAAADRKPWRVSEYTVIESTFWRYSAQLMRAVDSEGSNRGYIADPSNLTTENMYNEAEFGNGSVAAYTIGGSDAYGGGVIRSDVPTGFALKPIPVNRIVWASPVKVLRSGAWITEFRFCEPNGISGTVSCEPADLFAPSLFQ